MSDTQRPPTRIAIAVVERNGQFLVGRRPEGVPLAGLAEFPGGKVEAGETPESAAVRECLEETGLPIKVVGLFPEHVHHYEHDRVQLHFFQCELLDSRAVPLAPYKWVDRQELAELEFPAGNRELLRLLTRES